jgi:hypothetical protein
MLAHCGIPYGFKMGLDIKIFPYKKKSVGKISNIKMSKAAEYMDLLLYIITFYAILQLYYYIYIPYKQCTPIPLHAMKSGIAPLMLKLVLMSQSLYP